LFQLATPSRGFIQFPFHPHAVLPGNAANHIIKDLFFGAKVLVDGLFADFSFQLIEYSPAPEEVFKAVLESCLKKKCLSFTYYSPATEEKSERTVEPYHLFNYMGTWHTIGYCHLRDEIRDFALSRISGAKFWLSPSKPQLTLTLKNIFFQHSAFTKANPPKK
jgi:hypothetical protein